MTRVGTLLLVAAGVVAAGCGSDTASPDGSGADGPPSGTLLVAAAASLTDVMDDVLDAFVADHPDVDAETSFGGSSSLAVAIEEGAPVDVFASADEAVMDGLVDGGEIVGTPALFATNEIVLAVPAGVDGSSGPVSSLDDVARGGLLIGACASQVPCGAATDELLDRAGVTASFDSRDADVRAVVTRLVEGELDAGFVYRTDVAAFDDDLDVVPFPDQLTIETQYPAAVVDGAGNPTAARAFVEFLTGDDARRILERAGFGTP